MYGVRNGLRPEEQPAKRLKPNQLQAVMKGNHGTSLVEAMNAEEIASHLENLRVRLAIPYVSFEPDGLEPNLAPHGKVQEFARSALWAA